MSLSQRDPSLCPVDITIGNLDVKTWPSQKRVKILVLGSILIIYKLLKDVNNKDKDLKAKINYMILKIILKHIYLDLLFKEMRC